jgi:hypothetical protein
VDVPQSLHGAVLAHEGGWRLRVGLDGVGGVLRRVFWVLVMVIAVAMFVVGLAAGAMLWLLPDPSGHREAAIVLTVVLTGPVGLFCIYWAVRLALVAVRSAVAFYRVDLGPAAMPTRIVFSGWMHRSVVEVAGVNRVMVRERPSRLDLVLRTGDRTVVCKINPTAAVDPRALAGWLSEILAPVAVPVRYCDATWDLYDVSESGPLQPFLVARLWDVPERDFVTLATRCEVRTTVVGGCPMFDAHDVEWSAEQARTIAGKLE